jgi:5-(carboxyamino)imidazole ribonucleotide synthase
MIGVLGGGQLARMTALAARSMGYRIAVLDPDPNCAAAPIVDEVLAARFDDPHAALELARRSAVVTYEIERIAPAVLHAVAQVAPLRPGAAVLGVVQDRITQKQFLNGHDYPVGAWESVTTAAELEAAVAKLGACRVKRSRGGYDGRSQMRVTRVEDAAAAFAQLGGDSVAESELALAGELSVLVSRSPRGEIAVHPPAANRHRDGVLTYSILPAPIEPRLAREATSLALSLADDLSVEGLLVVEMFVTEDGDLLVNELAPRPHNTFHAAAECGATSQFEQFVRAICGLPLGTTESAGASVLINLLGRTSGEESTQASGVLAIPGVSLHLYGKQSRPGRKIGHVVARGPNHSLAWQRASDAMRVLGIPHSPRRRDPLMKVGEERAGSRHQKRCDFNPSLANSDPRRVLL